MLQLDNNGTKPYYVQIYEYFRDEIESRRLPAGEKMTSVRDLAQAVNISKMTVEKAYYQLASEGYIIHRNKARYEVASLGDYRESAAERRTTHTEPSRPAYRYDFGSGDMDMEHFPLDTWRKSMNHVLSEPARLMSCGDEQGVPELRQVLSQYVYQTRGVYAGPGHIVIGTGTLSLLSILMTLLGDTYETIGVENPGFRRGREIFRNRGFEIHPISVIDGMMDLQALTESGSRLVYVSPSHQFPTETVMPAGMRHRLLQWANDQDGMIIEDDYDSELRYYGRPVPALQGLDKNDRVIYMGSLSKVLPPFVRLSYMVLPDFLMERYNANRELFRQGASIPEQLVLAEYIRSGELGRQIRRLRKDYQEKGNYLKKLLTEAFGERIDVSQLTSGVYCRVVLNSKGSAEDLQERAQQQGCRVLSMKSFYENQGHEDSREFLLSFSKIPSHDLKDAVMALRQAWLEKEGS